MILLEYVRIYHSCLLCSKPSNSSHLTQSKRQVPYKGLQSSPAPSLQPPHTSLTHWPLCYSWNLSGRLCLRAFAFSLDCFPPVSCLTHSLTSSRSLLSCCFLSQGFFCLPYPKLQAFSSTSHPLLCFMFFRRVSPFLFFPIFLPLEHKLHKVWNFCLFCSLLYLQCLAWCLAHSRHLINI